MIEHIEIKRVHVDGGRHCYEKAPPAISFSMQPAKSRPMRFIRQGQKLQRATRTWHTLSLQLLHHMFA